MFCTFWPQTSQTDTYPLLSLVSVDQVMIWIREDRWRVIILSGMGGIGKSALAMTLLQRLVPSLWDESVP